MSKIIGIGNALVDLMVEMKDDSLLETFELPKGSMQLVDDKRSEKIRLGVEHLDTKMASGGSAANTIHGLAGLKVDTAFIGKIGQDEIGKFFSDDLENSKIDTKLLKSNSASGLAVALVSKDAERTFATFLGAAIEMTADDLKPEMFAGYDYFHIEGYLLQNHDLIRTALKYAKQNNCKTSLDFASYNVVEDNLEYLKEIVKEYVDIIFANEEEAKAFTGEEPEQALELIAEMCEIAVVKIGKNGSLVKTNGNVSRGNVIDAKVIDTTGAGDYYASGFLYGLTKNYSMEQCAQLGSILSGKIIELIGAHMTDEKWNEIKTLLKEQNL